MDGLTQLDYTCDMDVQCLFFSGLNIQAFLYILSGPRRRFFFLFVAQGDVFFFSFCGPRRQSFLFWPKDTGLYFFPDPRRQSFLFLSGPGRGLFCCCLTWTRIRLCPRNLPFVVQEVQTPQHCGRQEQQVGYTGHCLTEP